MRSVVLVNIHITTQDILQLRSHKPRLYSLSVTACDADWWNLVDGDDLRAFINNATTSCETEYGALLPTSPRSNAIFVTEDVWDVSAVHNPRKVEPHQFICRHQNTKHQNTRTPLFTAEHHLTDFQLRCAIFKIIDEAFRLMKSSTELMKSLRN